MAKVFVGRDGGGNIERVGKWPAPGATEELKDTDPEVLAVTNPPSRVPVPPLPDSAAGSVPALRGDLEALKTRLRAIGLEV